MSFALALAIAASWWGSHGVTIPCHPTPEYVNGTQMANYGIPDAAMASWPATYRCVVLISTYAGEVQDSDPVQFCNDVTHEFGNLAGVPETMGASRITDQTDPPVLWDCKHWKRWRRLHWR